VNNPVAETLIEHARNRSSTIRSAIAGADDDADDDEDDEWREDDILAARPVPVRSGPGNPPTGSMSGERPAT
jgi:hypothetical protein